MRILLNFRFSFFPPRNEIIIRRARDNFAREGLDRRLRNGEKSIPAYRYILLFLNTVGGGESIIRVVISPIATDTSVDPSVVIIGVERAPSNVPRRRIRSINAITINYEGSMLAILASRESASSFIRVRRIVRGRDVTPRPVCKVMQITHRKCSSSVLLSMYRTPVVTVYRSKEPFRVTKKRLSSLAR